MASKEDFAGWIVANADKKGTPEFETVKQAFNKLLVQDLEAKSSDPSKVEAEQIKSTYTEPLALAAQGINKGIVGMGDMILNTPTNLGNLGRAAIGMGHILQGDPELAPQLEENPNYLTKALYKAKVFDPAFDPKTETQRNAVTLLQSATAGALSPADSARQALSNVLSSTAGGVGAIGAKKMGADEKGQLLAALMAQTVTQGGMNLANESIDRNASLKAKNATRDANNADARKLGISLSAEDTNPTGLTGKIEAFAGKPIAQKIRSRDNAEVVNSIARKDLGLSPDTPLNDTTLSQVRRQAYQSGYEPMKQLGDILPGKQFKSDLAAIKARYDSAAESFPQFVKDEVSALVSSLDEPIVKAGGTVETIRILREDASKSFRNGDNGLGVAQKSAAKALEDMLERAASNRGANGAELAANFKEARQTIAKSHTVQDALSKDGVNVSARSLAQQLRNDVPLSGDLKTVAEAARTYPNSFQPPEQLGDLSAKISLRDEIPAMIGGTTAGVLSGSPTTGAATAAIMGAIPMARPAVRSMATSQWYQNKMGTPSYDPSLLARLLSNGKVKNPSANSAILASILSQNGERK